MALLDLPNELFEPIVHDLVASSSVEKMVQYRGVCKTFDLAIVAHLARFASQLSFSRMFRHTGFHEVFKTQGEHILTERMLSSGRRKHTIVAFVQDIVAQSLNEEWLDALKHDKVRVKYTSKICGSLIALDPVVLREYLTRRRVPAAEYLDIQQVMPAVAAALGKPAKMFNHVLSPADLLDSGCAFFPNALDAAAASGSTETLRSILHYLAENVKGKPEASSWDAMRSAARGVGNALRVAIRLHNNEAAKIIFDWLHDHKVFNYSTTLHFGDKLVKDCMRYGNGELIHGAMLYLQYGTWKSCQHVSVDKAQPLSASHEKFLFKYGNTGVIESLLRKGHLRPNADSRKALRPPLTHALFYRRYRMARILIDHGADISGKIKNCFDEHCIMYAPSDADVKGMKTLGGYSYRLTYASDDGHAQGKKERTVVSDPSRVWNEHCAFKNIKMSSYPGTWFHPMTWYITDNRTA